VLKYSDILWIFFDLCGTGLNSKNFNSFDYDKQEIEREIEFDKKQLDRSSYLFLSMFYENDNEILKTTITRQSKIADQDHSRST
jgi:hypothetical protein